MYLLRLDGESDHPAQIEITGNDQPNQEKNQIFQQDWAPPHYPLLVPQFLDASFPGKWAGGCY